jgi:predicted alpha-1,2-mannosidase
MKNSFLCLLLFSVFSSCQNSDTQKEKKKLISYVNPFIGTSSAGNEYVGTTSGGNTYPGAVRPFGMVSVSPHNDSLAPSGFFFGEPYMYGFGHVHLSGVGCQDLGNVVLLPTRGKIIPGLGENRTPYQNQIASPGYYRVDLIKPSVTAEMTATERSGISRYTFNKGGDSCNILLDLTQGAIPRLVSSPPEKGRVKMISNDEVEGFNYSGDFCYGQNYQAVYFVARFSKPAVQSGLWKDGVLINDKETEGQKFGAWFNFSLKDKEAVLVKVGISYVSIENARKNLEAEQNGFDFERVKKEAENAWEKELSKVLVEGGSEKERRIFYSGLYHMLIHPNILSDVNGEYPAMKRKRFEKQGKTMKAEGYTRYSVFSLWDTYRNVHSFFSLVYPERQADMVKSMIAMYEESGYLPKWELASGETYTMVGDPSIPVIADTYIKGIRNFDAKKALEAMLSNANRTDEMRFRPGIKSYIKYGYIPMDDKGEWLWGAVSTTLEYNYADWTLAAFAKAIGEEKVYEEYLKRSMFYKNLYDSSSGFIRPRMKNGSWYSPFDPLTLKGGDLDFPGAGGPGFVEGNAWHYLFFVPHDIPGLITLMGGKEKFLSKLDQSFNEGHYILWNEPDMAYPFLYDYIEGMGWRTQEEVRKQMKMNFDTIPGGIPGNDDCGTISAFYVLGAMGFYPACPATTEYQICSPLFDKVTIQLNPDYYKGEKFIISTKNNSPENMYIQSGTLNGKPFTPQILDHLIITAGGELIFTMSSTPNK